MELRGVITLSQGYLCQAEWSARSGRLMVREYAGGTEGTAESLVLEISYAPSENLITGLFGIVDTSEVNNPG